MILESVQSVCRMTILVLVFAPSSACDTCPSLGDYDPSIPPADAIIVTKAVRGEQCYDERREPEAMTCELARHGVRAYQLTTCDDCLDVCAACGCPLDQFFAVKIEPAQLDAAESAGWRQGASIVDDCNKEVGWDCGAGWWEPAGATYARIRPLGR